MRTIDQYLESIESEGKQMEMLPTGFPSLDRDLYGGFMRKELIIIGGFTGYGKSYVAGQLLWNIATQGHKSAYFSLEISGEMIVSRLVGSLCNIHPTVIVQDKTPTIDLERLDDAKMKLSTFSELIDVYDDLYGLTDISEAITRGGYSFAVIDFIQNVQAKGDEYERLTAVSLALQRLAKRTNCCILALSQLSNSAAKNGKSGQVEYKGSGGIAMVADLGFLMARGENNKVMLNLMKNRRGSAGMDYILEFKSPGGLIYEK